MLTLLTFPASFEMPSHSPFCVKAMCLLEMAGVPWRAEYMDDPRKMPLGKLPVLKVGAELIPDSAHIQVYLEGQGADFFPGMSAVQRAQAHAVMALVEGNLHYLLVHERWINDANWNIVRDVFFKSIPAPLRKFVTGRIRKTVVAGLQSQGFARFSEADRLRRVRLDLEAIRALLGDQAYLFGTQPCAADAIVAPILNMLMTLPVDCAARRLVREQGGLADYVERCRKAIYPAAPASPVSAAA